MTETHVVDINFTVTGQTGKVYKGDAQNGTMPIIGRDASSGSMVVQFIMASTATNQEIETEATTQFNNQGWY